MNLDEMPVVPVYKEFYGKNTEQMELLVKEGRVPLTVKQIIERRLNSKNDAWFENYFDTCDDAVMFKGKVKIIKDCDVLKRMNSKTKLKDHMIKITVKKYNELKGKEFNQKDKEGIWKYLLEDLYDDYIKKIGFVPEFYKPLHDLSLGAVCVIGLEDGSRLDIWDYLDSKGGRLVGYKASKTQKSTVKTKGGGE